MWRVWCAWPQIEDLRTAEREYQQAIEQLEAELHNSQVGLHALRISPPTWPRSSGSPAVP